MLDHKEGWTQKNQYFWTVVLEKTFESSLDCKEIQLPILNEISSEYSLEGLMLNMKLQYFGHLMLRANWLEKSWMLGDIEDKWRRGQERMRWLNRINDSIDMNLRKLWGKVEDSEAWCTAIHGVTNSWTWLRDWTTTLDSISEPASQSSAATESEVWTSQMVLVVKNPPAMQEMQETWVWLLCWEDPLKEGMATHSSILAGRFPRDRGAWGAIVHGVAKSQIWLKWLSMHTRKS